MIKTTRKSRALYEKHLNQYVDYENGGLTDRICYMCHTIEYMDRHRVRGMFRPYHCNGCPLDFRLTGKNCDQMRGHIRSSWIGATKKQAKSRMNWIIEQIHKFTDCEIVDDV